MDEMAADIIDWRKPLRRGLIVTWKLREVS
jgi:hypothetical protein